jgi:hypothetical protein
MLRTAAACAAYTGPSKCTVLRRSVAPGGKRHRVGVHHHGALRPRGGQRRVDDGPQAVVVALVELPPVLRHAAKVPDADPAGQRHRERARQPRQPRRDGGEPGPRLGRRAGDELLLEVAADQGQGPAGGAVPGVLAPGAGLAGSSRQRRCRWRASTTPCTPAPPSRRRTGTRGRSASRRWGACAGWCGSCGCRCARTPARAGCACCCRPGSAPTPARLPESDCPAGAACNCSRPGGRRPLCCPRTRACTCTLRWRTASHSRLQRGARRRPRACRRWLRAACPGRPGSGRPPSSLTGRS